MADPFYTLRFTDPLKAPFIVNPNTANGPLSPNTPAFPPGVVSANTTLLLLGRGSFDYGQPIQQDLIYMLENFANSTAPSYPIQGQLWYKNDDSSLYVYDGAGWQQIVVSGGFTTNLDMNGFKIVNLGNATASGDAVSLGFGDGRYVNNTGDTMTGNLTMSGGTTQIILPNAPTAVNHATNKSYVDTTITTEVTTQVAAAVAAATAGYPTQFVDVAGDTMTGTLILSTGDIDIQSGDLTIGLGNFSLPIGNFSMVAGTISLTNGDISMTNGDIINAAGNLSITNGTMTVGGISTFGGTATFNGATQHNGAVTITNTSLTMFGPASLIDMDTNRILNLGTPILGTDAANKDYVDTAVGTSGGDGVVFAGNVDSATGVITLNRTLGLPDVILSGAAAPFNHTHQTTAIFHNTDSVFNRSFLREITISEPSYPDQAQFNQTFGRVDEAIYNLQRRIFRTIVVSDGIQTTFNLDASFRVDFNRVQIFADGVKLIASQYASASFDTSPSSNIGTDTGLSNNTAYRFNITVNSVLYTNVQITTPLTGPVRFYELVNLIDAQLITLGIPATCYFDDGIVYFTSEVAGSGSNVTLAPPSSGLNLLTSITGATTPFSQTVSTTYAYRESGIPGQISDQVVLTPAQPAGVTLEIIVFPS